MRLRFDHEQEHQTLAVDATMELLKGGFRPATEFSLLDSSTPLIEPNLYQLDDDLLGNLNAARALCELAPVEELVNPLRSSSGCGFQNFTFEMETGTGKTYVMLRTIYRLHAEYGLRKFVLVVPSLAIRENTIKSAKDLAPELAALYPGTRVKTFVYDSANPGRVREFARAAVPYLMVVTLDAFNKAETNVMLQPGSDLDPRPLIETVAQCRPVVLLDEPQNMESTKSKEALARLDPLVCLRYSASHRDTYNLTYQLTPAQAYNRGLVKKVEVLPHERTTSARPHMRVLSVEPGKRGVSVKMEVMKLTPTGDLVKRTITLSKPGTRLEDSTRNPAYKEWVFAGANARTSEVRFTNAQVLGPNDVEAEGSRQQMWDAMVRSAVETHFEKVDDLRGHGVKPLTLFFVSRVADVIDEDGRPGPVLEAFDREYRDYVARTSRQVPPAEEARSYYFAPKAKRGQKDSTGKDPAAAKAYDLIMKGKERLCSFEEKVSFLFSHTALREGWDNPNVFVIATLADATSEMRKRQEIGRGVRLCVNQDGDRPDIGELNTLTVVTNETYERYVKQLQGELDAEGHGGEGGAAAMAKRRTAAKKKRVKRTKAIESPLFEELWARIARASRYSVELETDAIVEGLSARLRQASDDGLLTTAAGIERSRARIVLEAINDGGVSVSAEVTEDAALTHVEATTFLPDVVGEVADSTGLTRQTVLEIIRTSGTAPDMLRNPVAYVQRVSGLLRKGLRQHYVDKVQYEPVLTTGGEYEYTMRLADLPVELSPPPDRLRAADPAKSAYDHAVIDSDKPEGELAELFRTRSAALHYVKLPRNFTVPTPVGEYNPDWAVLWSPADGQPPTLSFVVESKPTRDVEELRQHEQHKVACGERHFKAVAGDEVDFLVVSSPDEWAALAANAARRHLGEPE